jgi:CheY-like chemotaxis protein
MARSIMVVESDFDALGALASKLRARGLEVAIADSVASAVERARAAPPEAVIVDAEILAGGGFKAKFAADPALSRVMIFTLYSTLPERELHADELDASEVEDIVRRMHALPLRASTAVAESGDVRGNLQQIGILDLLQLLSMNRRSGSLSITTQAGAGEVRLADGEIVDAVYRRLEGEKALYRLLGESEGVFSFASGAGHSLRRIVLPTRSLLLEGMRHIDETRRRREQLDSESDAFLAIVPPETSPREAGQRVLEVLLAPRTLSELLDEVPVADLDVLEALSELLDLGHIRRIPAGAARVELADAERLTVLAALAKRAARAGFRPPVRVAIAASQQRLATFTHAVNRIADAIAPTEMVPSAPIPHALATLRLAEGGELGVVGLPLVEAYAPLWALVLPSCAAVARLDPDVPDVLESACSNAGVVVVDASALLPEGQEGDPEQVASLLSTLLERAAGG